MRKLFYLLLILFGLQLAVALLTYGAALYFDEASWHYIGRNWLRHGLVPYRGGFDNKSPLIILVFGVSDLLFGVNYWFPRVLGAVVEMVGVWFLYRIGERLAGRTAGVFVVSMYGLSLLWQSTGGKLVSLTETYEVTCLIMAVWFFMIGEKDRRKYLISGMLAALGFAFRLTAVAGIGAIFLYCLRKSRAATLYFVLGGVVCVLVLVGAGRLAGIDLVQFWHFTFLDNLKPGNFDQHRDMGLMLENFFNSFFHSEVVLFYPLVVAYIFLWRRLTLLGWWLLAGVVCISAIGLFDPTYLKDILPALSLMGGLALDRIIVRSGLSFRKAVAVVWVCWFPKTAEPILVVRSMSHPVIATPQSYCQPPYSPLDNYSRKQLGLWIKANTRPEDKVYIANRAASILVYTERLSPTIYFNTNETDGAKKTFYREMEEDKPALVAIPLNDSYERIVSQDQRDFLSRLVASPVYRMDTCMYGYVIYRKK